MYILLFTPLQYAKQIFALSKTINGCFICILSVYLHLLLCFSEVMCMAIHFTTLFVYLLSHRINFEEHKPFYATLSFAHRRTRSKFLFDSILFNVIEYVSFASYLASSHQFPKIAIHSFKR